MKQTILVTGGAGYIGSLMVKKLVEEDYSVVVVDNLSGGEKNAVDTKAKLIVTDLSDRKAICDIFQKYSCEAVLHFAGVIAMGESMKDPGKYFKINVFNTLNLLEEMVANNVNKLIFSSTAGVYGNPETLPIPENHPKNPTNPYGESKFIVEKILGWYDKIYKIRSISLRYFNACGAAIDGSLGENHNPETHIIPLAMKALLDDKVLKLFGDDYKTKDGTCVRDYIHIEDLCRAHLLALRALARGQQTTQYNVGTGEGYSNKEVLETIESVTGRKMRIETAPRRPGDVDELVADPGKIKKELGWKPEYSDLRTIVETAWEWHKAHPHG
ncbi:MAG: UDP-glucose 4-epimerase GalE, partial [bacterium]|nr:UDP-glucose 4-epimerase GalE [bacterium]